MESIVWTAIDSCAYTMLILISVVLLLLVYMGHSRQGGSQAGVGVVAGYW